MPGRLPRELRPLSGRARKAARGAVVGLLACLASRHAAGGAAAALDSRSSALTAANPAPDDTAVVGILAGDHVACSGVLVAPRVVITAAHCAGGPALPEVLFVAAGAGSAGVRRSVQSVRVHPRYSPARPAADDLALLRLAEDPPPGISAMPLPAGHAPLATLPAPVRLVGFGHASDRAGDAHERRTGPTSVTARSGALLTLAGPTLPCYGDSGGAVLAAPGGEALAGIVVSGDERCAEVGLAVDLAPYLDSFVLPFVNGTEGPSSSPGGCSAARASGQNQPPVILALALALAAARRATAPGAG